MGSGASDGSLWIQVGLMDPVWSSRIELASNRGIRVFMGPDVLQWVQVGPMGPGKSFEAPHLF